MTFAPDAAGTILVFYISHNGGVDGGPGTGIDAIPTYLYNNNSIVMSFRGKESYVRHVYCFPFSGFSYTSRRSFFILFYHASKKDRPETILGHHDEV